MAHLTTDHTPLRVQSSLIALLVATLALAIFQSNGLVSWSYDLPINPLTELIVLMCETWNSWMESIGAVGMSEWIEDWILRLQDAIF